MLTEPVGRNFVICSHHGDDFLGLLERYDPEFGWLNCGEFRYVDCYLSRTRGRLAFDLVMRALGLGRRG